MRRTALPIALLMTLPLVTGCANDDPSADARSIAEQWTDAVEAVDLDAVMALYADHAVLDDPHYDEQRANRAAINLSYSRVFSGQDTAFVAGTPAYTDDGRVHMPWTWSGTDRATGDPFTVEGVSVLWIEDGLIVRETVFYGNLSDSPLSP